MSAPMGFFSKGIKNENEIAVVKEPSAFEPLNFYFKQLLPFFISLILSGLFNKNTGAGLQGTCFATNLGLHIIRHPAPSVFCMRL